VNGSALTRVNGTLAPADPAPISAVAHASDTAVATRRAELSCPMATPYSLGTGSCCFLLNAKVPSLACKNGPRQITRPAFLIPRDSSAIESKSPKARKGRLCRRLPPSGSHRNADGLEIRAKRVSRRASAELRRNTNADVLCQPPGGIADVGLSSSASRSALRATGSVTAAPSIRWMAGRSGTGPDGVGTVTVQCCCRARCLAGS